MMIYYSSLKRNEILTQSPTWMNLEYIIVSKISQEEGNGEFLLIGTEFLFRMMQKFWKW